MKFFFELIKAIGYSLLGAGIFFMLLTMHDSSSKSGTVEFINNTYWIHAPDGSTGFEIIQKKHPFYDVKIYLDTPDNIKFQGTMKYIGNRKEPVCVFEASGFDGSKLLLIPGGYLEKRPLKEKNNQFLDQ